MLNILCASLLSRVSLQPHGLYPSRLLCPGNFPGKNTGVGCHALPPVDLPDPGIEPESLAPPALAGGLFTAEIPEKPQEQLYPKTLTLKAVDSI